MMDQSRRRTRIVFVVGAVPLEREHTAALLRGIADQVGQFATSSEIDSTRTTEAASVIVLVPDDTPTIQLLDSIRQFRVDDPGTAMLLCLRPGDRTQHQLAAFARSGIDDLVLMDAPEAAERLRRDVAQRLKHALPVSLVRDVTPRVEHSARRYCAWCYRNAYRALHIHDVAEMFDEDPTTVKRHLGDAGLPGLHDLIACARLLYVGYRLDTTRASIKAISGALSFESATALDMFVKRATSLTPSELRERGAVEHIRTIIDLILRR